MIEGSVERILPDTLRFSLEYQPIVDVESRAISGVEVLCRLRHGERNIPPTVFIPSAEKGGWIEFLTSMIIDHACSDLSCIPASWNIHINVSPIQLFSPMGRESLYQDLKRISESTRRSIVLEITEKNLTPLPIPFKELRDWMIRMNDLGLRWYLDDFGRGQGFDLLSLPLSGLKVDRDFTTSDEELPLLASRYIAREKGIDLIAEGVETRQDYDRIRKLDIQRYQGYFAAPPLDPGRLSNLYQGVFHAPFHRRKTLPRTSHCRRSSRACP